VVVVFPVADLTDAVATSPPGIDVDCTVHDKNFLQTRGIYLPALRGMDPAEWLETITAF
jgi:hypothetical protein